MFFLSYWAGYEGAWLDNRAHGHGTFTESSGTSYEGTEKNDTTWMDGCLEGWMEKEGGWNQRVLSGNPSILGT